MIPKEVFNAYGLNGKNLETESLQNGLINSTWKIKHDNEYFILQKINQAVFKNPDAIASNVRLIADYLHKTNPHLFFCCSFKNIERRRNG